MTSGLKIESLSVARGGQIVLSDIDLEVPRGAWCGLIGVNGAGKTTLLRAVAGRLAQDQGAVCVEGVRLDRPRDRARHIGLSVSPERLPDVPTVARLLAEVARAHGVPERPDQLAPLWRALVLDELIDRPIHILSAGQKQRLGIHLAFMGAPSVVLLDEPFNALDPLIAFDLKRVLKAMAADGLTIVTAMHDLAIMALHCSHGLLLSHGRLAEVFDAEVLAVARRDPAAFEASVLDRWRHAERSGHGTPSASSERPRRER